MIGIEYIIYNSEIECNYISAGLSIYPLDPPLPRRGAAEIHTLLRGGYRVGVIELGLPKTSSSLVIMLGFWLPQPYQHDTRFFQQNRSRTLVIR